MLEQMHIQSNPIYLNQAMWPIHTHNTDIHKEYKVNNKTFKKLQVDTFKVHKT